MVPHSCQNDAGRSSLDDVASKGQGVDWKNIARTAALLMATNFAIGFVEGFVAGDDLFLAPGPGMTLLVLGQTLQLVVATFIFMHMALRQARKPFIHAGIAALVSAALPRIIWALLPDWLGDIEPAVLLLEWAILFSGLIVGVSVGVHLHQRARATSPSPSADGTPLR